MYQQLDGGEEKIEKARRLLMKHFPWGLAPGFSSRQLKSRFHYLFPMCLRTRYLASISPSFLLYKLEIIVKIILSCYEY